jgi:diacylglycerol kinase family enzyme
MRVTLVHNPSAGPGVIDGAHLARHIREAGHDVTYRSTGEPGWDRPLGAGCDLVVAAGGDGTVRKVFAQLAGGVLATIVPLGTANNIAGSLGFPLGPVDELVAGWASGRVGRCDLLHCSAAGASWRSIESVGAGLFAELLVEDERRSDPGPSDKAVAGLQLLARTLDRAETRPWSIEVDGCERSDALIGVEILNIGTIGPSVPLAPSADPSDGSLDVALLAPSSAGALRDYVAGRLLGEQPPPPPLTRHRGRRVTVTSSHPTRLHIDDEPGPTHDAGLTWHVSIDGAGVDVLLPPPGGGHDPR